ncbi:MAG: uracil phosphoribosyltransferase [Spartobacteria bacterium]|nr:uracil phosphoribosyltransferase [Spartobacteria bacterium]
MKNVFEIDHPLIQHHVTRMRDKNTSSPTFRHLIHRLSRLLTYEATKDFATEEVQVETPLTVTQGRIIKPRVGLIPILRAGLGMVDPVLDLMPEAEVWHLGFYRDETTFEPVEYYKKLPDGRPVDVALVLDPMLATGGSAVAAIQAVRSWGVPHIKLLSMIAAPEGIQRIHAEFPDTQIYVCAVDSHLNEQAYIVPGLGDAGDRIFNATAK